jgi:hypothetical protein
MEYGYRREIVIAIVAEALAIVGLAAFLAVSYRGSGRVRRTRGSEAAVNPEASRTLTGLRKQTATVHSR